MSERGIVLTRILGRYSAPTSYDRDLAGLAHLRLIASYAVIRFSATYAIARAHPSHSGWRSSMAEQQFCKSDRDERPLGILYGFKVFL